jgi:hypothetical protein
MVLDKRRTSPVYRSANNSLINRNIVVACFQKNTNKIYDSSGVAVRDVFREFRKLAGKRRNKIGGDSTGARSTSSRRCAKPVRIPKERTQNTCVCRKPYPR